MGGWDRGRGFILRSFVETASRTTIRRENRALQRMMSVQSDEMQSRVGLMGGRKGEKDGEEEGKVDGQTWFGVQTSRTSCIDIVMICVCV